MNRHKSTISRELSRNRSQRGYRPKHAKALSQAPVQERDNGRRIADTTWAFADARLRQRWSPQQICAYLKAKGLPAVSHESLYQRTDADKQACGTFHMALRCQKRRKKRYGSRERRGTLVNQVSNEQRPAIVATRKRYGDWEGDLVIGAGQLQALVTLNERKSRYTLIGKVTRKTAQAVSDTMIALLTPFTELVHSPTTDNGRKGPA